MPPAHRAPALEDRHLLDFVDTAAIGLHWVAADGTIVWANKADYEPLGYTADEYIGHNITEFHADADTVADILHRLASGERIHDYEARLRCKDGSFKIVHITSSVLFDDNGDFVHTRCFTRDVTAQKEAEDRLRRALEKTEEALRVREVFLAIAAHELKTPITPLRLQVDGLLRSIAAGRADRLSASRLAAKLGIASRQVVRLEQLVNALLDVSRIESGTIELDHQNLDIVALVRDVAERHRAEAAEAGAAISVEADEPIFGLWDALRVDQVITNLIANAIRHGQGAPIRVTFDAGPERVRVTVRDEGPGIAPAERARVFGKFERAASARHRGGLGLGLWIVRHLVDAMHGCVALAADEGRGAAFTVDLPRRPEESGRAR